MNRMRHAAGFSLIEVMCAILILGVGLVGLTQGITTALRSSKEGEVQTVAALLAAGQIETVRAEGYLTEGETEGDGGPGLTRYRWRQSIGATSIEGLYDVRVVVEQAKTGTSLYELRTLLFEAPFAPSVDDRENRSASGRTRRGGRP